jgi:hypothetical protein
MAVDKAPLFNALVRLRISEHWEVYEAFLNQDFEDVSNALIDCRDKDEMLRLQGECRQLKKQLKTISGAPERLKAKGIKY